MQGNNKQAQPSFEAVIGAQNVAAGSSDHNLQGRRRCIVWLPSAPGGVVALGSGCHLFCQASVITALMGSWMYLQHWDRLIDGCGSHAWDTDLILTHAILYHAAVYG